MNEKVVLVTGGTSGIGKAAAMELARQGMIVVFTSRDSRKGEDTLEEIRTKTGNDNVHMLELDLASLDSIRQLSKDFKSGFNRLDVLINNAGGYYGYRKTTRDGFEYTFGVNHLGHFVLTNLLKEQLVFSRARIINVSSEAQKVAKINFDDLMLENNYHGFKAYSQAKLANIIFTYELAHIWGDTGVTANAVHPGAVGTNFGAEARPFFRSMIRVGKPFLKSPEQGADSIVYLAASPEVKGITGKYFARRRVISSAPGSDDPEVWRRLWEVSEELTGIN